MVRLAHCKEPLHGDGQGHVGGSAERHSGHGVEEVHIDLGEKLGVRKPVPDKLKSCIGVHRDVEDYEPEYYFQCFS